MRFERVFHADDWGLSPGINLGILELARRGLLRSASCISTAPYLEHHLSELAATGVEIYLHLNLTYGVPLTSGASIRSGKVLCSHRRLMARGLAGRLVYHEILAEVRAQVLRLRRTGILIQGVNGHHHVHLWPGVREPLLAAMREFSLEKLLLVRDPAHLWSYLQSEAFVHLVRVPAEIQIVICGYLRPRDWRNAAAFAKKISRFPHPLLIHPALKNDFVVSGMTDDLREERVSEFNQILEFTHGSV